MSDVSDADLDQLIREMVQRHFELFFTYCLLYSAFNSLMMLVFGDRKGIRLVNLFASVTSQS